MVKTAIAGSSDHCARRTQNMQQASMVHKLSQAVSYHAQLVWGAHGTDQVVAAVATCSI